MPEVQWIKLYIDMFDKRKINKIRRLPNGDSILLFWVMLLATAGKCNAGGLIFITERVPFTKDDLADEFDLEVSTIELALKAFVELDMIELSDEGFISVINWEKYQSTDKLAEIREQNRDRKRLQRERQKQALLSDVSRDSHVTVTDDVTGRHAIEEEEEEDKEKEFHSILHPREEVKLKYMGGTLGQGVVLMSDEQFSDLCDKLSIDEIDKYMGIIVECERNGKRYKKKSHYQAILEMADKDRRINK